MQQETTSGSRTRGRLKTTRMDNIVHYTLDKIVMYSEDTVKWRQLVNGVAKP